MRLSGQINGIGDLSSDVWLYQCRQYQFAFVSNHHVQAQINGTIGIRVAPRGWFHSLRGSRSGRGIFRRSSRATSISVFSVQTSTTSYTNFQLVDRLPHPLLIIMNHNPVNWGRVSEHVLHPKLQHLISAAATRRHLWRLQLFLPPNIRPQITHTVTDSHRHISRRR